MVPACAGCAERGGVRGSQAACPLPQQQSADQWRHGAPRGTPHRILQRDVAASLADIDCVMTTGRMIEESVHRIGLLFSDSLSTAGGWHWVWRHDRRSVGEGLERGGQGTGTALGRESGIQAFAYRDAGAGGFGCDPGTPKTGSRPCRFRGAGFEATEAGEQYPAGCFVRAGRRRESCFDARDVGCRAALWKDGEGEKPGLGALKHPFNRQAIPIRSLERRKGMVVFR